jgi:aspartyl protease family protein
MKVRYLFYWTVIAFISAVGYMYQTQLSTFGQMFVASMLPGKSIERPGGVVEVMAGSGGHFFVDAELNGTPVHFLVDTGASTISISRSIAINAGIDISKLVFSQVFQTANGKARGASAKIDSLKIGNYVMKNVYVSVSEVELDTPLLGMAFLDKLDSYTFAGNSLYLHFKQE